VLQWKSNASIAGVVSDEALTAVLERVQCVKVLIEGANGKGKLIVTNSVSDHMIFYFPQSGLDQIASFLKRWAVQQKADITRDSVSLLCIVPGPLHSRTKLSLECWTKYITDTGALSHEAWLQQHIFEAGVRDEARGEVWRFLLSLHNFSDTLQLRCDRKRLLAEEYSGLRNKVPASGSSEGQRFIEVVEEIEKDAERTDSSNPFISGSDNPNMAVLKRLLLNYALHNPAMGYIQGLSELLVPIMGVIRDESDTFWCFDTLVRRSALSQVAPYQMYHQLALLRELLGLLLPSLHSYLSHTGDALKLACCHRWLLLMFKREFSKDAVLGIWDCMLSAPSALFQVFICAAMMSLYFTKFIKTQLTSSDLLIQTNALSGRMDSVQVLQKAKLLYSQLLQYPTLPCSLKPLVKVKTMWEGPRAPIFTCQQCNKGTPCDQH